MKDNKCTVLVFDTETTWLPSKDKPIEEQPHIIQFAWMVVEIDMITWEYKELSRINQFIRPPYPIPSVTSDVHWIYDIDVMEKWFFEDYAKTISYYLNKPDFVVAHNLKFDETMIRYEYERLRRLGLPYDFLPNGLICTMEISRYYCNLPSKSKFAKKPKAPKLQELVKKTCWTYFEWAHDALVDVEWTLKAFEKLVKEWVVKFKKKKEELKLF